MADNEIEVVQFQEESPSKKRFRAQLAGEPTKEEKADIQTEPSKAALTTGKSIELVKMDEVLARQFLDAHPVIPIGIDKKSNRIINRGYIIIGKNEEMKLYIQGILKESGGLILIKNWIKDGYGFGNGYLELVPNKAKNKILYVQIKHPVYFGYYKKKMTSAESGTYGETWGIVFDEKTNEPMGFCEYVIDQTKKRVPLADKDTKKVNILPMNRVAHLPFNTWGDEIEGTSVMQTVQENIKQIMNIEKAGAETMYRNGFVQKKFKTNLTSTNKLKDFAKNVKNVNDNDVIVLSKDTDVENLNPGSTDFVDYHEQWLQLLSIALEMPKPLITQSGTSTNKATLDSQKDDMYEDTFSDELIIKKTIDEQIIAPAILMAYPSASPEDYPEFRFKARPSDVDTELKRKETISMTLVNLGKAAESFKTLGMIDRVDSIMTQIDALGAADDIWNIRGEFEDGIERTRSNYGLFSEKRKNKRNAK